MITDILLKDGSVVVRPEAFGEECLEVPNQPDSGSMTLGPVHDDSVRSRLADVARQEAKRRHLREVLRRPIPAWNPADHPELDAEGGAAAWVRKLRSEAEQGFERRTQTKEPG